LQKYGHAGGVGAVGPQHVCWTKPPSKNWRSRDPWVREVVVRVNHRMTCEARVRPAAATPFQGGGVDIDANVGLPHWFD
jgi:hypothetical protein